MYRTSDGGIYFSCSVRYEENAKKTGLYITLNKTIYTSGRGWKCGFTKKGDCTIRVAIFFSAQI